MSDGPDLSHFVQHRQLDVYEQGMARQGYAYGVDLRRSRWLASSTVGNSLVRTVDRAWPQLAANLLAEAVSTAAAPTPLLRELARYLQLLRSPLPTVRLLRPEQRGRWPLVTPLGATRGGALWLVLDAEALLALEPARRAFLLGAGLGHLHCDHAVYFSAHLLASRRDGSGSARALRSLLRPWTKVMGFSADRAGLLACGSLETALSVLDNPPVPVGETADPDPDPAWLPAMPALELRQRALREFARSAVFARVTAARSRQRELTRSATLLELRADRHASSAAESAPDADSTSSPAPAPDDQIHVPADAWSLARVDARLTDRLGLL